MSFYLTLSDSIPCPARILTLNIYWPDCLQLLSKLLAAKLEAKMTFFFFYQSVVLRKLLCLFELNLTTCRTSQPIEGSLRSLSVDCREVCLHCSSESSRAQPQCGAISYKLKGNEKIAAVNTNEAEICWHVRLSGWAWPSMFSGGNRSLLYITVGVKGQTGAVIVRALSKCQPTPLHINNLNNRSLQSAVLAVQTWLIWRQVIFIFTVWDPLLPLL